ncbi:MAG: C40 family peptidase [Paludibacteraceae bacterium]|nr:C40 family peptidase [Paludibacteraceae bacterium]
MVTMFISYAIVLHSIVPVRSTPSEAAEQETQLLFGETCVIQEEQDGWYYIRNDYDGQVGWVDCLMVTKMTEQEYREYTASPLDAIVKVPMAYAVSEGNGQTFPLNAGTHLSNYRDGQFSVLGSKFRIDPQMVAQKPLELTKDNFMQTVRFFLNIPYLWGGKNCMGMDCSGFSSIIMSLFGKKILRNAREQATQGTEVGFLEESRCGDLVFFGHITPEQQTKVTHVGILLSPDTVIHCSGRVKAERIDSNGIISSETGRYTHDLLAIRRY